MSPRLRAGSLVVALAAGLGTGACIDGPFVRDNLLDAQAAMVATIVGVPDTVFSLRETVTVALVTDPALPTNAVLTWSGYGMTLLAPGVFRPSTASHLAAAFEIQVEIGPTLAPRRIVKQVIVRQRMTSLALDCEPACSVDALLRPQELRILYRDALGSTISDYQASSVHDSLLIRDTTIVRLASRPSAQVALLVPVANGSTWIVVRGGALGTAVDSSRISVQQRPYWAEVNCPLSIGDEGTAQIEVLAVKDPNYQPFQLPWPSMVWSNGYRLGGSSAALATVSPEGLVTKLVGGGIWVTDGHFVGEDRISASCAITLEESTLRTQGSSATTRSQ